MKRLGIYTGIGYPHSIEERLSAIKTTGFDVVCLDFEKELVNTETSWENQLKLAQKYSLPVEAVHLTGSGTTSIWDECEEAEFVTNRLIGELCDMSKLGVNVGVAHITWGFDTPKPPSQKALDRFLRITEAAEKYKVKLALENSVFAEQVRFVLDNINSKYVGFCYDSGHENAFTPNENYLESYYDRMFAMHLHDNNGSFDNHYPPFHKNGTIDWNVKVEQLKKTDLFSESVIIEVGRQDESLEEVLKQSYESAVKLSKM